MERGSPKCHTLVQMAQKVDCERATEFVTVKGGRTTFQRIWLRGYCGVLEANIWGKQLHTRRYTTISQVITC